MERCIKKAKTTSSTGAATSETPDDTRAAAEDGPKTPLSHEGESSKALTAFRARTRSGGGCGAPFGARGSAMPACIVACVLDCLTLSDVARFVGVSACAQAEVVGYYAAAQTLVVGSARELGGRASLRELPLALRMCACLRKLVVRNADARYATMWDCAARAKQAASEPQTLAALLRRNSRTLTWLHMDDPLNADVSLALRECRELVVLNAPAALPALLRDGRCPERWPHQRGE